MFREMRRNKQAVSREGCVQILKTENRGVLSVVGDEGYPYAIPMNFYYEEKEEKLYFHCAREGHKIDAIKKCDKVCFTTWNSGYRKEGEWAWNVTSVVAMGRAEFISDINVVNEKLRKIAWKYYPEKEEAEEAIIQAAGRVQILALRIEKLTGKLVKEK